MGNLTKTYAKIKNLINEKKELLNKKKALSDTKLKNYQSIKKKLINSLDKLCLSEDCINFFIMNINELNKKLIAPEGNLLKLSVDVGINRKEFLQNYNLKELNPDWPKTQSKNNKTWKKYFQKNSKDIKRINKELTKISNESNLAITELKFLSNEISLGKRISETAK